MANMRIDVRDDTSLKAGNEKVTEAGSKLKETKALLEARPFSNLEKGPNFLTNYSQQYLESVIDVLGFSEKVAAALSAYVPSPIEPPAAGGDITPLPGENGGYSPGGNGGLTSPGNASIPPSSGGSTTTPGTDTNSNTNNKANLISTKSLENMKLSELDDTVGELKKLAETKKQKLDEYMKDGRNANELKNYLLKSKLIPQEFKDLIMSADPQTVRILFNQILKGERPEVFAINNANLGIIYKYLLNIAQENNMSVEELLSGPKNQKLLQDTLGQFKNVVELFKGLENTTPEEFQKSLLNMYDGNVDASKIAKESVTIVRNMIDFISEETGIYYEQLLTDTGYAKTLKAGVMDFAKSALFVSTCSEYTDQGMRNTMSNLFNGNNIKALGMDENKVNQFKNEIDNLAKENGTTSDKLLSNAEYSDKVKEGLQVSKSATGVGSIFKDAKSSVSQNVAKNIYNTKFETNSNTNK